LILIKDPYETQYDNEDKIVPAENYCYMFFFELGVVVFWNMTEIEEKSIISEIKSFEINSYGLNFENDDINYQGLIKLIY
jgi:uncharacterized Rmd1/YagE family protein